MSKFCESTYEEAFIDLLEQNGWEYTCGDDLHRKLDETIIEEDLRDYLSRKYADEALADDDGSIALRGGVTGQKLNISDATAIQKYLADIQTPYQIGQTGVK